ncbi:MAG: class I SAM-dependent methyltransferase [Solirubrobacterales bacterium]
MESTNYRKFQTGNPVVRRLIDRFYGRLSEVVDSLGAASLLDAGCGEGETLARIAAPLPPRTAAVDLNAEAVAFTAKRFSQVEVTRQSILDLSFGDESFDLVVCLEVLEHLTDPRAALAELGRVASKDIVVSVPHEPWFRAGSLLRGKYLRGFGNHPEHLNHWTPTTLRAFLETRLEVVSLVRSMPWLIAHCRR